MADFIIVTILVVVVFFILRSQFWRRDKGACCGCSGCAGCKSCAGNGHTKTQTGKTEGEMSRR